MITVDIPEVGSVDFPDGMSPQDISAHAARLHGQAVLSKPSMVMGPDGQMGKVEPREDTRVPSVFRQAPPGPVGQQLLKPMMSVNNELVDKAFSGGPLDRFVGGAGKGLLNLVSASTTPAYAAIPAVGKIPGIGPAALSAIGLGFGGQMLGQTVKDLSSGVTPSKLGEAMVNVPLSVLMAGHGAAGLGGAAKPGIEPIALPKGYEFPAVKADDLHTILTGQEVVPPERQLGVPPVEPKTEAPGSKLQMARQPIVLPQQVEGPVAPSPVPLLDKALPPGAITQTPGRNPELPVSGEQPPVALSFQELGKKVNRTPEEEARFQELKAKSDEANKKMAADWAAQLKAKTPVKTEAKSTRTLMDAEAATLRHDYLPWLTPEQRSGLVKEYTEGGDIKAIEQKAQALRKQVIQDRITTEKQTNETKQKEGSNVQAPGILPKQGLQSEGSGGAREGSGGSVGTEQEVQAKPQDEVKSKEEVLNGKGIGGGIAKALDKNKTDESGMVDLRGVIDTVVQARKKLAASLATRDNKKDIVRDKDVADNAAVIVGQRARTGQESLAKVLFGPRSKKALNATTAAIEAKGNVKALDKFISIARAKNDQSGLNAATFAKANWDKIQPLVKRAEAQHNMVFNAAKSEGVNVDYRTGYIRHLYDLSKLPQHYADLFFGESGGSGGKGFKKERTFDTLYDAIDAGYGKAIKSWNSAELLEHRLRRGFQEVNDLQWAKHFASVKDPSTGSPVVSLTERPGYERWSPLGQTFYIHRGYGKVFEAAQGMSAIRKFEAGGLPVGDIMMKGLGTAKHSLLMFDSYHAMRMAAKSLSLTGDVGHRRGLALLEYNPGDLKAAVQAGDITQEMADWANKNRATANLGIKAGLNIGRVQETIDSDIVRKLNILGTGTANKWIFEKFTRGVMLETFVSEFDRVKKANNGMTDDAVAKKVARDLNFNFGNIGRQGILRSATAQDMARMVFLAPQWFESMAQTEARSVGQMAKVPVTGKVGTLAKGTGTLLLAMFVATQVANMASKGHPTWDNPEGHKMDAWIPGTGETKNGLYVSPFSLPMELTHDMIRYTEQGKSPLEVADKIVGNKLSPPARAGHTLYEREDYAGRKLTDKQALIQAGKDALPLPLLGQAYLNPSASFERQAMASAGLKTEPAESPRQRLQQLARKVSPSSVVYPVSQYAPLKNLIENGKIDEAKAEYQKLIKGKTEKEVQNVENYFKELPNQIHTGSQEKEQKFYDGLSPEDKKLYQEVRKENKDLSDKFFNEVLGHSPKMSRTKRKRFSAFTYENDN